MITKLQTCLRRLWAEEDGFVLSSELVLGGSLLLGGAVLAFTQVRDTLTQEFADVAQAIGNLDQSYSISGIRGHSAFTAGSAFYDRADLGDGIQAPAVVPGNRFVPPGRPLVCADVFPSAPPAFVPPPAGPPPQLNPKPVAPPKQPQPPAQPKPNPQSAAVVPPRPAPCPHCQGMPGCMPTGCGASYPAGYGCFPGGYYFGPNTNYSFPSMGWCNPYGVQQWGGYRGAMSTVIDFQPPMPGASGVPGWGGVTGAPCGHAPCVHGLGCRVCVPGCGSIPCWGPREGSLPQQRIMFTPAPQPGGAQPGVAVQPDDVPSPSDKPQQKPKDDDDKQPPKKPKK